eukprot:XP_011661347.1 PREDICTED: uncharacterized protein LOC105436957 [Strongylocentrotus purpuratus]
MLLDDTITPCHSSLRQTCTGLEQKARSWRLQRGRSGSVTQPQTPTKSGAPCPCCCCNEVLMRLQVSSLRQTCTGLEQKARSWRLQRGRSGSVTQPQTPTKSGAPCPCCCCNEVLMRLQSLLCSEHLTDEVALYVIDGIEDMKECRGKGSLQLLCQTKLDTKAALSVVIQEYPSIAVEFSSHHCEHREDLWSHVLVELVKGLEEKTTDGMETRKAVSLQMLSGVLGYLVQELEASALLSLLPSDLPLTLTMPYMERSLLRDRASRLREEIVAAGMESIKGC